MEGDIMVIEEEGVDITLTEVDVVVTITIEGEVMDSVEGDLMVIAVEGLTDREAEEEITLEVVMGDILVTLGVGTRGKGAPRRPLPHSRRRLNSHPNNPRMVHRKGGLILVGAS